MKLFFILIFIKQLLTEQSIGSGEQGWLETARDLADWKNLIHWKNVSFISHQGGMDFSEQTRFAERLVPVSSSRVSTETVRGKVSDARRYLQ